MAVGTAENQAVVNRVKRAQGQLAGVLRMIEEERDLAAVLNQLKAVSSALDRAGFAMVAAEWRTTVDANGELAGDRIEEIQKLFLSIA